MRRKNKWGLILLAGLVAASTLLWFAHRFTADGNPGIEQDIAEREGDGSELFGLTKVPEPDNNTSYVSLKVESVPCDEGDSSKPEAAAEVPGYAHIRRLAPVIGGSDAGDIHRRLASLSMISADLSMEQCEGLYAFLLHNENLTGLSDDHWLWLKNDIMTFLRESGVPGEIHADRMIAVFRAEGQDDVIRDYALQHLYVWADEGRDIPRVESVLMEGLAVVQSPTIPGTSLMALARLHRDGKGNQVSQSNLSQSAFEILTEDRYQAPSKVSALQILASLDLEIALPEAANILANDSSGILLRVSAVGVLRQSTHPGYRSLLLDSSNDTHPLIRRAAILALKQ